VQAPRYRLRFITGVSLTSATYGSGTYGTGTYGEQASDPLASLRYILVPWPGGYLPDPAWIYRQGDVTPQFRAQVLSDEGPLDFTGLDFGYLVLTNTDGSSSTTPIMFPLTVATIGGVVFLTRTWLPNDLMTPGTFRAGVVLQYSSGRRLTIPTDDRYQFVVNPNSTIPSPPGPGYVWDGSRWNYAYWS
jgi:hypothetical protein